MPSLGYFGLNVSFLPLYKEGTGGRGQIEPGLPLVTFNKMDEEDSDVEVLILYNIYIILI
jgi:hypothetical protein